MVGLSRSTKLKLVVPILYWGIANVFFVVSLDTQSISLHHLVGIVVSNIAFVLWIISRVQLGNAFSLAPTSKFLVTSGIYSKLRHPVYYFSILAVVGISIFIWQWHMVLVVVILLIIELIRIREEEAVLQESFGKEYSAYKQKTWI